MYTAVYGYYEPTRAQRVAVRRAVRELLSRGLIGEYTRRVCPVREVVAPYVPWEDATRSYGCCGYAHQPGVCVGRPLTEAEAQAASAAQAAALRATR